MDVAGGSEAESASEFGGEVRDDVAEEIVGDDDVELAGIADEFHGKRVDVEMAGVDVGILGANGFEDALPEIAGEGHGVGFVGHAQAFQFVLAGVVESVAEDAFNTFARVNVLLGGDLVGSALLEKAAGADVDAFGVFAEDYEANVVADAIFERSEAFVEELGGTGVDEEIELETEAQENIGGMLIRRDSRIAERAEEDSVEFVLKYLDRAFRERDFFAEVFIGGPVEFDKFYRPVAFSSGGFDGGEAYGSDFFADAIARNDGDT